MSAEKDWSRTIRIELKPEQRARKLPSPRMPAAATLSQTAILRQAPWQADRFFQELFRSVYDAALLVSLTGAIRDANPRAVEFLGAPRETLIGASVAAVVAGCDGEFMLKLARELENEMFALIQGSCVRRDQSSFPAEIAVNRLLLDETCLCFFIRDITRRKQVEDLLRAGYTAMQNAAAGIAIIGSDGRFDYYNEAWAQLWRLQDDRELRGGEFARLFADPAAVRQALASVAGPSESWSGELMARRADGGEFPAALLISANRNVEGEITGAVVYLTDQTEARKNRELQRRMDRQNAMLATVGAACHHLAQPATVLTTQLGLLKRLAAGLDPAVRALVDGGIGATDEIGRILNRLNALEDYRVRPYLEQTTDPERPENLILDI